MTFFGSTIFRPSHKTTCLHANMSSQNHVYIKTCGHNNLYARMRTNVHKAQNDRSECH